MSKSEVSEAIKAVNKSLSLQMNDMYHSSTMSSLILSVCIIDALAGFYSGYEGKGTSHKSRFNKFILKYLPAYVDLLHSVRNGLIHSFANLSNLLFTDNDEFKKVFPKVGSIFSKEIFDVQKFKDDMVRVYNEYLMEVSEVENKDLRSNFLKRYKSLGIIQDFNVPVFKNMKGEITAHIDDMDRLPGTNIPFGSMHPLKFKH
jgi:hypothetical protein